MMIEQYGANAQKAKLSIANATTAEKNTALRAIASSLKKNASMILEANQKDVINAQKNKLAGALIDRLTITEISIDKMIISLNQIANLPDPVGEITGMHRNEKGLQIGRIRAPIGVIGIIYESRPNVTVDAAAICLKSGNACILRGGSESINSNLAIIDAIQSALSSSPLDANIIQFINQTDRRFVKQLLEADHYIDLIIPRGGKNLVKFVSENAKMPVLKHLNGICHLYVDKDADLNKAIRIADNGKTFRYGICGSTETLLIHQQIAASFLPKIQEIFQQKKVEIRGCSDTQSVIRCNVAEENDWSTEYLDAIISIKIVDDHHQAIDHINHYGSKHTDAIATENLSTAQYFINMVDSSSVMINTPTCFADGYEYGLGAEIGISTDKLHWRGPVGVVGLTCEKFIVTSDGITRE